MGDENQLTDAVIGAAIRVHQRFGPGLLESVYTPCLGHELLERGLDVEISKPVPLTHGALRIERAFVLDLVVNSKVVVEVKCVQAIANIHVAQLLTYLRLMHLQVGLILNFNVVRMKDGIRRVVNCYRESPARHEFTAEDAEDAEAFGWLERQERRGSPGPRRGAGCEDEQAPMRSRRCSAFRTLDGCFSSAPVRPHSAPALRAGAPGEPRSPRSLRAQR